MPLLVSVLAVLGLTLLLDRGNNCTLGPGPLGMQGDFHNSSKAHAHLMSCSLTCHRDSEGGRLRLTRLVCDPPRIVLENSFPCMYRVYTDLTLCLFLCAFETFAILVITLAIFPLYFKACLSIFDIWLN